VVGTCLAMALAGLIYMYIIKIVEPRLVKRYNVAGGDTKINWIRANWELVAILSAFLLFVVAVIAVPYQNTGTGFGLLPVDQRIRYAILLFLAIALVGGISFAYSVRSRGLIETSRYLERVMRYLKNWIAYCNAPQAPELYNDVAEEHGNIIRHVLKQFTFNATVNKEEAYHRNKRNWRAPFDRLARFIGIKEDDPPWDTPPVQVITLVQPWEERYFPHIVEELKAAHFEYAEQEKRLRKAEEAVAQHKEGKARHVQDLADKIADSQSCKTRLEDEQINVGRNKAARLQHIYNHYNRVAVDLLDGFHLGLWYRENGMGPTPYFYQKNMPLNPLTPLISVQQQ
jgi:hypothetical protein